MEELDGVKVTFEVMKNSSDFQILTKSDDLYMAISDIRDYLRHKSKYEDINLEFVIEKLPYIRDYFMDDCIESLESLSKKESFSKKDVNLILSSFFMIINDDILNIINDNNVNDLSIM